MIQVHQNNPRSPTRRCIVSVDLSSQRGFTALTINRTWLNADVPDEAAHDSLIYKTLDSARDNYRVSSCHQILSLKKRQLRCVFGAGMGDDNLRQALSLL